MHLCFCCWETAKVVYWLESEACGSGAGINCCVYLRSAAVCVFALAAKLQLAGYHTDSAGFMEASRLEAGRSHHYFQSGFKHDKDFRQTQSWWCLLSWSSFGNWINPRSETDFWHLMKLTLVKLDTIRAEHRSWDWAVWEVPMKDHLTRASRWSSWYKPASPTSSDYCWDSQSHDIHAIHAPPPFGEQALLQEVSWDLKARAHPTLQLVSWSLIEGAARWSRSDYALRISTSVTDPVERSNWNKSKIREFEKYN